ncbi:MAG: Holliday junction branch migration protein RuvA [Myxococcota bacterium]|nr:Holliday junction branch migration protein RuvA [Myxococcota bacterium]
MIGRLIGKIAEKSHVGVLVDVGGVGYDVAVPLNTLANLPPNGETVTLYIHTHVREDDLRLFGFAAKQDLSAFRTMLGVGGVGPKLALTVIGALSGAQLASVIEQSDVKRLSAIPGIGKKTAERIILELRGKLAVGANAPDPGVDSPSMDALASALKNLGFRPTQVERVIEKIRREKKEHQPFESLLRLALSALQEAR